MKSSPVAGDCVLVTGGTGSFGSTVVRRMLDLGAGEIRVFSRDELKQHDMRQAVADPRVRFIIGDVRDRQSVTRATRGANYVFHAAALKQVPSCEFFPLEAVATNIQGSANVIEAAIEVGVKSLVCLSTDKAVYPVNAMGMSKAMMEKTAQAFARTAAPSGLTVSVVRYGNVLASRGSVIPLFARQIKSGKPMTITNPEMTRFLMSLDEAVMLVEHAFMHANPGDLFVRKAPAATVQVLALAVAQMLKVEPSYELIGTRHGEKVFETLATMEELARGTDEGQYFRIPLDDRDLNYSSYFECGDREIDVSQDYHSHNTDRLSVDGVVAMLEPLPDVRAALGLTP